MAAPDKALKPGQLMDDLEFLMRAVRKVEQIRTDLGKVGPVIAAQVAIRFGMPWCSHGKPPAARRESFSVAWFERSPLARG